MTRKKRGMAGSINQKKQQQKIEKKRGSLLALFGAELISTQSLWSMRCVNGRGFILFLGHFPNKNCEKLGKI